MKYKDLANKRFNSAKNRSIMIQDRHNDMRNDVMKRIYSRQLDKRRKGNFRIEAIKSIKEETEKAEKIATEKFEAEKREIEQLNAASNITSTTAES